MLLNFQFDESLLNLNLAFIEDPVLRAIKCYENHPSIKGIEKEIERKNFSLSFATFIDIEQLKSLKLRKASQDTDSPTRILKENCDLFAQFILKMYNEAKTLSTFPNMLMRMLNLSVKNISETKYKTVAQ